jgi:drug/metabolite transporter (DMT)-like permease
MIRRKLIFGIVFLTAGALLLLSPSIYLNQPPRFVKESEQDGRTVWHFNDPTDFGECAGWAGLISITLGITFFAGAAISATRRRPLGD